MAAADSDFSKTAPEQGDPRPEGTTSNDRTQAPDSPPGSGSVLENFLSLGSGIMISKAVAFIGTAYLARRLGVYGFGIIGFATAVCTYFAIALKAGFGPVGAREVARHPGQIAPVSAGVIVLRLTLAGGVLVLTYLGTLVLDKPEIVKWVVMLTALTYISLSLDTGWVYKGLGRNRRVGVSLIMAQAIYVAALLLLVRGPEDILWVPLSLVFGELFAAAYLAVPLFRGSSWAPDLPKAWSIFHASIPLVIGQLLRALINVFDVVLLALLLGEVSVGLYTAAYRICFLVILIGHSLQVAYLPALSRAAHRSNARASQLVNRALEFAAAIAVPMAAGGILLAGPLLIHLFGPEYGEGTEAFRLLLISVAFIFVHGVFGNTLLAHDRTRVLMWIQALGASLNVVLNLILIPLHGIVGAAVATVAAEGLILSLDYFACRRLGLEISFGFLIKPIVAATVMATVLLWLGPESSWLLRLVAGIVTYSVTLTLIGGIPADARPSRPPSHHAG
ncbi:MAG: oligosaccharide flippase family protein [Thermoanaerobaculia bacterium]